MAFLIHIMYIVHYSFLPVLCDFALQPLKAVNIVLLLFSTTPYANSYLLKPRCIYLTVDFLKYSTFYFSFFNLLEADYTYTYGILLLLDTTLSLKLHFMFVILWFIVFLLIKWHCNKKLRKIHVKFRKITNHFSKSQF